MSASRWPTLKLNEACSLVTDGTHHSPPNGPAGNFRYITAKNIKPHGLDLSDVTFVSRQVHDEIYARCPVAKGDVLYIKDGVTTGLAAVNPLDEPFSLLSSVALLKPKPGLLDSYFLKHWLNSPKVFQRLTGSMTGTAIRRLVLRQLRDAEVPIPPLNEQRRIVAKLEALLARSRRAKQALDAIPALLERFRQSVLAAAFRGDLTRDWRAANPDVEPASKLLERVRPARVDRAAEDAGAGGESAELERKDLPEGWVGIRLDELASDEPRSIQSGPFGSNLLHSEFQDSGVLVIGIDNVREGAFSLGSGNRISQEKFRELSKYSARPGDVLITVMATVGRCCVVPMDLEPAIITKHVYRISPERRLVEPEYLMFALLGAPGVLRQIEAQTRGQTRAGINGGILRSLVIPVAPLEEQQSVVGKLRMLLAWQQDMGERCGTERGRLDLLDESLLRRAFEGELVPQDPTDEPASVLLERVRSARDPAPAELKPSTGTRTRRRSKKVA